MFYTATDYIKANRIRTILQNEMQQAFRKCDIMAVPGSKNKPRELRTAEQARASYDETTAAAVRRGNTSIGNMTGYPALVLPCGMFSGTPTFPITIQLYGKPFDEFTLYRAAHAYESATDWHLRRAPVAG